MLAFVTGCGDEIRIILRTALKFQEFVIAAFALAGIITATSRARLVNRTAAFFRIEKLADAAVMLVFLPAHNARIAMGRAEKLLLSDGDRQFKMRGNSFSITLGDDYDRIGAAIARTFRTIILGHAYHPSVQEFAAPCPARAM